MRLLVIEDHPDVAGNIGDYLAARGHTVDFAGNGVHGLRQATEQVFDAIVLDVNLPRMNGFELCRRLREEYQIDVPVLMITARGGLSDKTAGFQAGAWDYLVKPFALEELELRLNALALRRRPDHRRKLQVGDVCLDLGAWKASRAGTPLTLHNLALRLLEALMRASPDLVSRSELEHLLWGDDPPESNPLRSHLSELRKAMDRPYAFKMLRTVHGVGYRLVSEDDDAR
jgi:DNA-binding response OmpR family regulator